MTKLKITALSLALSAASFSSHAIVNGSSLNWQNHSNLTVSSCTGMVVADKYILTAAHCISDNNPSYFANGSESTATTQINHPESVNYRDFSFWVSTDIPKTEKIDFLNPRLVIVGDVLKPTGFGGTGENLNQATMEAIVDVEASTVYPWVLLGDIGKGHTMVGDSGGANYDENGYVTAITVSGNSDGTYSAMLHGAADWILETVNGWHYQTGVTVSNGETKTIKVQSLHTGTTNLLNTIYTDGDANIDTASITCESPESVPSDSSAVNEFDICTLQVTSNGGHGFIYLTDSEKVEVNEPADVINPEPEPNTGGGSGGSTSIFSLLALGAFGILRKRKLTK